MSPRRRAAAAAVAAAALVALAPPSAHAFCRTTTGCADPCPVDDQGCPAGGKPVKWTTSCVGLSLDHKGSQLIDREGIEQVLDQAMKQWNDVDCGGGQHPSVRLMRIDDVDCDTDEYTKGGPNANIVHFRDESWVGPDSSKELAKTFLSSEKSTGNITDTDLAVNTANKRFSLGRPNLTDTYDLRAVLVHELGHVLGLAHTRVPNSSMLFDVETGQQNPITVSADDIAAICSVYPPGEDRDCDPTPEGGLATTCVERGAAEKGGCAIAGVSAGAARPASASSSLTVLVVGAIAVIGSALRRLRRVRGVTAKA